MRHRKKFNHLSRKSAHRKAMFANMASSLILHKRIKTTIPKAKALRMFIEPLITKAKYTYTTKTKVEEATFQRRVVFSYLKQKKAVTELFREVAPKVISRNGGYTRILKLGKRLGDNAEMCFIELVDFNENMLKSKEATEKKEDKVAKKTTRRGRRGKGTAKKITEKEVVTSSQEKKIEKQKPEAKKEVKPKTKKEVKSETKKILKKTSAVKPKTSKITTTKKANPKDPKAEKKK